MKKTVIGVLAMASLMCAGQASALTLEETVLANPGGPVSFKFSGYTETVNGTTVGAFALTSFYQSWTAGSGPGELSTWAPDTGNYVYAIMEDLHDVNTAPAGVIYSKDGQFSLYETTTALDPSSGPGVIADIANSGNLLLTGNFVPNDEGYTMVQSFHVTGGGFDGAGNAYAALTGGSLMDRLDSNGQLFGSDLWFSFNYNHTATNAVNWGDGETGVAIYDPAKGAATNPIPEPATMLLFGTGLIGLAGVGRRLRK